MQALGSRVRALGIGAWGLGFRLTALEFAVYSFGSTVLGIEAKNYS